MNGPLFPRAETALEAAELIAALDRRASHERVDLQGCRTVWRRFGDGPPLVLLHGGHGSWLHWIRNIDALIATTGRAVWAPDLPGFGDSDALQADAHDPDRISRLVDVVAASLDRLLGVGSTIDLAGFSFGGLVSAHIAARRGHVRRLALLGPAGHRSTRRPLMALIDWRVEDRAARLAALRHNLEAHMIHDPARVDELALTVHEISCEHTRFRSKEIALAASLEEALSGYTGPALGLWGDHDVTATPKEAALRFIECGAGRATQIVGDAGHWVQYEQAAVVNAALSQWFA